MKGLTPGRIVHYVLKDGNSDPIWHRAAIVTGVKGGAEGVISLTFFTSPYNGWPDQDMGVDTMPVRDAPFDEDEKKPGTWHWIEAA